MRLENTTHQRLTSIVPKLRNSVPMYGTYRVNFWSRLTSLNIKLASMIKNMQEFFNRRKEEIKQDRVDERKRQEAMNKIRRLNDTLHEEFEKTIKRRVR